MLVGVLTTAVIGGAALVEKAKIQKVIEDIDYYEKAFVQFTIQFGQVPGALTLKRCEENIDVFKKCMEFKANKASNLTSSFSTVQGHALFSPLQLRTAGYIKTTEYDMENGIVSPDLVNYSYNAFLKGMKVNYGKNARADLFFHHPQKDNGFSTNGACDYYEKFREKFNNGLYLVFFANRSNVNKWNGWKIRRDGLFSPKTMAKIDKKFDDGLPRKGKIQAIKQGTEKDTLLICYDKARETYETKSVTAKYINSNKVKQGCDLFYYLTDVSGYIY